MATLGLEGRACLVSRCAIGWRIGEGNVLERRFWPVVGTCPVTAALTRHLTDDLQIKSGLATEPGNATMACRRWGINLSGGRPAISHQKPRTWLWRIPKRIARYPDIARSIRGTIFAPGHSVFRGARRGQG